MNAKSPETDPPAGATAPVPEGEKIAEVLRPVVQKGKEKEALERVTLLMEQHSYHSGPLPPAAEIERLERTLPGSADRVIGMAEREQAHRHSRDNLLITREYALKSRGQFLALVALVCMLGVVVYMATIGQPQYAVWLGVAIIGAVVLGFLGQVIPANRNANLKSNKPPAQASLPKPKKKR